MMPTREQRDAVSQKIGWLTSMSYLREDGSAPHTASDTALPWWEDLSRSEQQAVLAADVDWKGFTEAEKLDVERRVLNGEDMDVWMNGVKGENSGRNGTKSYEVWHADLPRQPGDPELDFPEAYTRVATVQANGLEEAVRLTTHIDRPWQEHPGVQGEDGVRSTVAGDVIVDPQGWPYWIGEGKFEPVHDDSDRIPTAAESHAIFAEMMEDIALRKMPEDPASDKTYDQQLQEAAESGRFRTKELPEKGRER